MPSTRIPRRHIGPRNSMFSTRPGSEPGRVRLRCARHVFRAQEYRYSRADFEVSRRHGFEPHAADLELGVLTHDGGQDVGLADEIGDEGRYCRLAVASSGRADLVDHALVHDDDAIGDRQRFLLVVGDQDGRDAEPPLQHADFAPQPHALPRIECRQRLVEQQQAGRRRERARKRDALLLRRPRAGPGIWRRCRAGPTSFSSSATRAADGRLATLRLTSP